MYDALVAVMIRKVNRSCAAQLQGDIVEKRHVDEILNLLILEKSIIKHGERLYVTGRGNYKVKDYLLEKESLASPLMDAPCVVSCDVANLCCPGKKIGPETCDPLKKWVLDF